MEELFACWREKYVHWAISRVGRGCCMSLFSPGEGEVGIIAKKACSN